MVWRPREDSPSSLAGSCLAESKGSRPGTVAASLVGGAQELAYHPVTLCFRDPAVEANYLTDVSNGRWPVLLFIFIFDCCCYVTRFVAAMVHRGQRGVLEVAKDFVAQLLNMLLLYFLMGLLNRRSRASRSPRAAKQEELLLALIMSLAISMLLLLLKPASNDYVYAAFFLICAAPLLKLRWLLGTAVLAAPLVLAAVGSGTVSLTALDSSLGLAAALPAGTRHSGADPVGAPLLAAAALPAGGDMAGLPLEAVLHLLVAWAVGGLMAFLSDSNRRQAFAHHTLALAAAEKELEEVRARASVERELAEAQAQAAARALVVAREKASNEAKSEFMSLMCHEVRTPLNGCLASAEMLLDTELTAEQHDLARTIRVSGSILLSTVSNFLDFFKMEAGKQLDIVRTPLDLRGLVADVHCIIEAMIGRDGAVALLEPDLCDVPPTVIGDPNRVCGILLNLYTNAAKFTKQGAIGLRVRVVGEGYRPDVEAATKFYHTALGGNSPHASSTGGNSPLSTSLPSSAGSSELGDSAGPSRQGSWPAVAARGRHGDSLQEAVGGREAAGQLRPSLQYESQWKSPGSVQEGFASNDENAASTGVAGGQHSSGPGSRRGSKLATPGGGGLGSPAALGTAGFMRSSAEFDSAQSLPAAALLAQHVEEELERRASHSGAMELCHLGDGWSSVASRPAGPQGAAASAIGTGMGEASEHDYERRWLAFEVQDTGVGVAARGMDSLFQDYVQGTDLEMRRARSRGGTGLGLSICSKQVSVLGGQIGALSKPNCGSVFWFTIPLRVPASASQPASPHAADAGAAPVASSHPAARRSSLEGELKQLWGSPPVPEAGSAARRLSLAAHPGSPRCTSSDGCGHSGLGNSFGWYHLPPAGGAARTAANRLRLPSGSASGALAAGPGGAGAAGEQAAGCGKGPEDGVGPVPTAAAPAPNSWQPAAAINQYTYGGRGYGLWVLLVEDNLINQTVARKMLSTLGMKCQVASNGREAVEAVQAAHLTGMNFDVVLMDMCMPVLSGVDATKAIRQLGCTTPIVAMTANASERDRQECLSAGMNGFLSKPVLKDRLLEAILAATE